MRQQQAIISHLVKRGLDPKIKYVPSKNGMVPHKVFARKISQNSQITDSVTQAQQDELVEETSSVSNEAEVQLASVEVNNESLETNESTVDTVSTAELSSTEDTVSNEGTNSVSEETLNSQEETKNTQVEASGVEKPSSTPSPKKSKKSKKS